MRDVESNQRPEIGNPYSNTTPPGHPLISKIQNVVWMAISLFALSHFNLYRVLLRSPHIRHEWFKVGLAVTIAILFIKAYVELYEGQLKKSKVNYESFRQTTHAALLLMMLASFTFHVALWPHYGWNTPLVLGLAFFGVLLPFLLLVPTWVQNLSTFAALTFFLQQYQ